MGSIDTVRIGLTRSEWGVLKDWLDATGYSHRLPGETPDQWEQRTAPVSYQYAMIVEAACDHVYEEAYCIKCGIIR